MVKNKTAEKTKEKKSKKLEFYYAVGRRKESSARVRLYTANDGKVKIGDHEIKKGEIMVNYHPIEKYFRGDIHQKFYLEPFRTTNTVGRFAVTARISGGGTIGQLSALVHGISRALVSVDEEKFRPILRKKGFLTRDPRVKERRKAGLAQKARAKKQSPKR
ncbi:30S ribosomal protein S9 [Candidatus Gottesmanbacteria bacterium RBG_16_37_8]|uniref:30S ribosomal protein S9 n=1 Tax=Candidatus Gottesmanbacteria bacterium RBG_16_37_8 TaxID=1798371 RepID=A0A1F5YVZ6_9BACT|nr:MAG: 30S ribosomal protein S9 [Candidatus Gottesmanbacteria bacterium RBG_16_37_8]